jgi:hypothetical protein
LHPADRHEVGERPPEAVADVVLGPPVAARAVRDRDLDDHRSLETQEGGEKPVHPVEHRDAVEELDPIGAERASDVGDRLVGDPIANRVGDPGGEPPQRRVPAGDPHAADDVPAGELGEKPRDVRRVVLEVGVEGDHDLAAGGAEAGGEGGRLTTVAGQAEDAEPGVGGGELGQDPRTVVGRTVVHEEDLVGPPEGFEGGVDLRGQRAKIRRLVVDGHDDGEVSPHASPGLCCGEPRGEMRARRKHREERAAAVILPLAVTGRRG